MDKPFLISFDHDVLWCFSHYSFLLNVNKLTCFLVDIWVWNSRAQLDIKPVVLTVAMVFSDVGATWEFCPNHVCYLVKSELMVPIISCVKVSEANKFVNPILFGNCRVLNVWLRIWCWSRVWFRVSIYNFSTVFRRKNNHVCILHARAKSNSKPLVGSNSSFKF